MLTGLRMWGMIISILGALAVAMGAFGAHILSDKITSSSLEVYKTAVFYHFIHTMVALIALVLAVVLKEPMFKTASVILIIGVIFFSGSLYLLSLREVLHIESWSKVLGPITPLGGLLFITGWIILGIGLYKSIK